MKIKLESFVEYYRSRRQYTKNKYLADFTWQRLTYSFVRRISPHTADNNVILITLCVPGLRVPKPTNQLMYSSIKLAATISLLLFAFHMISKCAFIITQSLTN